MKMKVNIQNFFQNISSRVDRCIVMAQDAFYHRRESVSFPSFDTGAGRPWRKELEDESVDASRCARMDMTPVRINISLPKCVLEDLDRKAPRKRPRGSSPRLHRCVYVAG